MNENKTKVLIQSKRRRLLENSVDEGDRIEVVCKVVYLGVCLTSQNE
jgi:hypothetical protein